MRRTRNRNWANFLFPDWLRRMVRRRLEEILGLCLMVSSVYLGLSLASWSPEDPGANHATNAVVGNVLGETGATVSDFALQVVGLGSVVIVMLLAVWGWRLVRHDLGGRAMWRMMAGMGAVWSGSAWSSLYFGSSSWSLESGLGGIVGDVLVGKIFLRAFPDAGFPEYAFFGSLVFVLCAGLLNVALRMRMMGKMWHFLKRKGNIGNERETLERASDFDWEACPYGGKDYEEEKDHDRWGSDEEGVEEDWSGKEKKDIREERTWFSRLWGIGRSVRTGSMEGRSSQERIEPDFGMGREGKERRATSGTEVSGDSGRGGGWRDILGGGLKKEERLRKRRRVYRCPSLQLLTAKKGKKEAVPRMSGADLQKSADALERVLEDFGVKGQIVNIRPGPVVTLYELQPAPGVKSSRVIGLADDISRSMSAISARVAVIPGRNAIGIELPNAVREHVCLREILRSSDFIESKGQLPLALGKVIGGEPIVVDLARMPHLLIAGTTGSGKSVGVNTMILSLLYRLKPDQCRFIMIDPKMLELSIYDGIPHLLAPVVTDPKKAIVALKWTVREMEERYKRMSKLGVRNIDGFNRRVEEALENGEILERVVQTGFDEETGEAIYENDEIETVAMPYLVVIVDEMADLMMVAGKEIESAIQRLAQMARAAGIHLITATQRPSVDVITGTIKANFPTRISFQVTSKIDSRTILGEQGAEQLLGQGDMLYMAGGGRINRVHGPFVSDEDVERVVEYLKTQGTPEYLDAVLEEKEEASEDRGYNGEEEEEGLELYDQAVRIVLQDRKASTSYIQRRLSIGYNRAATLIERMEGEGIISAANHAGKREILIDDAS